MIRRLCLLIAGSLLAWFLLAGAALLLGGGTETVPLTAAALGVCLVPAVATLLGTEAIGASHPEMIGLLMLGGSVVRMVAVGAATLLLGWQVEFFHQERWPIWVVVFYLITLGLETAAVVVGRIPPRAR